MKLAKTKAFCNRQDEANKMLNLLQPKILAIMMRKFSSHFIDITMEEGKTHYDCMKKLNLVQMDLWG